MSKPSTKHVSATITSELHDFLNQYRWDERIDKFTDVIREALVEYAVARGYEGLESSVEADEA